MVKKRENVLLSPKFKKLFFIVSCSFTMVITLVFWLLSINGDNYVADNEYVFSYCTVLMFIFVVIGMIIDEKIRKYPGLLVTIGSSIYAFSFICICVIEGGYSISGLIMILLFLLNITLSFIIYKWIYPKIVVGEKYIKLFNTFYLIVLIVVALTFGMFYWI